MTYTLTDHYYEIKLASLITNVDKDIAVELYQPIVGSLASILYLTLVKQIRNEEGKHVYQYDRLLNSLQISNEQLETARHYLEAVGLLRTYESVQEDVKFHIFVLYAPKSPKAFFDDVLFTGLLIQNIGEKEAKRLANKYKADLSIPEDYVEVSSSFVDVYRPDYDDPAFKKEFKGSIIGREPGREEIKFNYDLFFGYVSENSSLNSSSFNKRELKEIERLAALFGLSEKQMAFIVIDEYHPEEKYHIDFEGIKNRCEKEIKFSGIVSTHESNISSDSILGQKVQMMEEVSPAKFLSYLQSNTKPAKSDINIINSLSKDYGFNNGIINVIVNYVLEKNENVLSKNYCEKIASSIARSNIHTTIDAMNYLNKVTTKTNKKVAKTTKKEEKQSEEIVENTDISLDELNSLLDEMEDMKNGK